MADTDLAALTAPLDDEGPCGVDLDADDDDAWVNYMAATEMALPDQYMIEDVNDEGKRKPFYAIESFKTLNLGAKITAAKELFDRTRDLRLFCLVARLHIFERHLTEFITYLDAIAVWLEIYWDQVHPTADSGLRSQILERLNERYTVVTALNNAPLFRSKRHGIVTWQSYSALTRDSPGREGDTASVDRVLIMEAASDLAPVVEAQESFDRLHQAVARILAVCREKLGAGAPDLTLLAEAIARIRAMLERVNPREDAPQGAAVETAQGSGLPVPAAVVAAFETTEAAVLALGVATRYLAQSEPSTPALLLLRQAQALVGKSFLDAIDALLPDHARRATVSVASLPIFDLQLRQLADNGRSEPDDWSSDEVPEAPPPPVVGSRAEALALLDRVAAYYRAAEPSSPIPLLIERGRDLVGRDFMSLIRTMLPDSILRGE